jgi:hypothetical protein
MVPVVCSGVLVIDSDGASAWGVTVRVGGADVIVVGNSVREGKEADFVIVASLPDGDEVISAMLDPGSVFLLEHPADNKIKRAIKEMIYLLIIRNLRHNCSNNNFYKIYLYDYFI